MLARCEDAREDAVELFDREILADVTVGAGMKSRMHLLFVITDTCKNDDWESGIHLMHESDERNAVYFGHLKIDNRHFAVVIGKPGCRLEAIGQCLAGVLLLAQLGDEEPTDGGVIVDDKELKRIAKNGWHLLFIISINH